MHRPQPAQIVKAHAADIGNIDHHLGHDRLEHLKHGLKARGDQAAMYGGCIVFIGVQPLRIPFLGKGLY